jgi:hypothetical protein
VLSPMGGKQKTTCHLSLYATRRIYGKRRNQNSAYRHKGCTQRAAHTVYHICITYLAFGVAMIHEWQTGVNEDLLGWHIKYAILTASAACNQV